MTLSEILGQLERRATDAARVGATAPVDAVLRAVIEDLRHLDDTDSTASSGSESDRLINVREAADLLGCTTRYLYDNHHQFPFTRRLGRQLRFSTRGIEKYLAGRR